MFVISICNTIISTEAGDKVIELGFLLSTGFKTFDGLFCSSVARLSKKNKQKKPTKIEVIMFFRHNPTVLIKCPPGV